jgi:hypothetical protein
MLSLLGCRAPPCEQPAAVVELTDPLACRPGTPEHEDARARVTALDRRIEALRFDEPVDPVADALAELRSSRCFERSVEHSERMTFKSSASLREWWSRGGREWLSSYLSVAAPGDTIVLPPTPREVLHAEALRGTTLERIACPYTPPGSEGWSPSLAPMADPRECGGETAAWLSTAHQAHEYWALWSGNWQVPAVAARWYDMSGLRQNPVGERCREAIEDDLQHSYRRWRACVEAERGRMSMLPDGQFRQPEHGWLLTDFISFSVSDGCSAYSAYHLDTGAAHWGEICEQGEGERHSGVVSAERVREAVLLSLLAKHAVVGAPFADAVRAPEGVPIAWPEGAQPLRWREPGHGVRIDHETFVIYRWWDDDVIAEGRLHGPYHGTGAEAHARSLHFNLQASRREGPAPIELPDELWALLESDDG